MSAARGELKTVLCQYIKDTLFDINTVKEFGDKISKWMEERKKEVNIITHIKDRADKINLSISYVTKSGNRGKAFWKYTKSKITQVTADSRREELEQELAGVLKDTLGGLEKLDCFLDAVERLAVTSLHVFSEENRVLHLPQEISPDTVKAVIKAAREVRPLLLEFQRDAKAFFRPKLQNVEVLEYQLNEYIQTTQKICDKLEKSSFSEVRLRMNMESVVDLDEDLSEDDIRRIKQLHEIRKDKPFRMVFLFKEKSCRHFISKFDERQHRMQEFLKNLEESAVHLESMNKGAKISSVAGNSVRAVGSILSLIGLALSPVSAGASLALTVTGVGLGITSGVNSAVTTATEIGVNLTYKKKAREDFQSFMEDVQILQKCLKEASSLTVTNIKQVSMTYVAVGVGKVIKEGRGVRTGINSLNTAGMKMLESKELIAGVGEVMAEEGEALCHVAGVTADVPEIGEAAIKGSFVLSNSVMTGFGSLSFGMTIYKICKDSISLAKGRKPKVSKFIRARAALWSSEMDAWRKIRDSLCEGLPTSEEKQANLDMPFYVQG
ncbi:apolipoprotein L2-like [Scomber japonicus]|uniref:apolipoprotein L2-like n=1 Tax=Scomber japonicus TaxID=13676 RepID=UPI00230507C3|nr:apolipoprotein L2-like [Scomber japonicus]